MSYIGFNNCGRRIGNIETQEIVIGNPVEDVYDY